MPANNNAGNKPDKSPTIIDNNTLDDINKKLLTFRLITVPIISLKGVKININSAKANAIKRAIKQSITDSNSYCEIS